MLSDRAEEAADSRILDGYGLADLDLPSLHQYRQRFASLKPTHPWLSEDDKGLLIKLGGWRRDRKSGNEGLTVAGLKWTPSQGQKRTNYQWAHGFTQAFGCEAAGRISAGERLSSPKLKSAPQGAEVCHSSGVR